MAEPITEAQSDNTPRSSRRRPVLVNEETIPGPPPTLEMTAETTPTLTNPTPPTKHDFYFVMFDAIARVLAARLLALIGVIGATGLAWVALRSPDLFKLGVLAIYALGLAGVVWLVG